MPFFQSAITTSPTRRVMALVMLSLWVVGLAGMLPSARAAFDSNLGLDQSADLTDELHGNVGSKRMAAAAFLPDGALLVISQVGNVYHLPASGGSAEFQFSVPDVEATGERGSLDLAVDPNFSSNQRVYVLHTVAAGGDNVRMQISRFQFQLGSRNATLNSRKILWTSTGSPDPNPFHFGGSINLTTDGYIFLSIGYGDDPDNAKDLGNVFGKVLRLDLDGNIPADNPFRDRSGAQDAIWAYGLRNPFRGSIDSATGALLVGDVGGNTAATAREEINLITRSGNYGWPDCEGSTGCPVGVTAPIFSYGHELGVECCQNRAVIGGEMYRAGSIPFANGVYLYGDFSEGSLRWVRFDNDFKALDDGRFAVSGMPGRELFPVWVGVNPADGWLYYVRFSYVSENSQVRRIRYVGDTPARPPVINVATAKPMQALINETIRFRADARDPQSGSLDYHWDFGDGSSSSQQSPTHTYARPGSYTVALRVDGSAGTSYADTLRIDIGIPPTATILAPTGDSLFSAGERIELLGSATDSNGDDLPATAMAWEISFVHDDHEHPFDTVAGADVTHFDVPDSGHGFEGDTGFRVTLMVDASNGLSAADSVVIRPDKVSVQVNSNLPDGARIRVDNIAQSLPFTIDTIAQFRHALEAEPEVCIDTHRWEFEQWSIGSSAAVEYRVPAAGGTLTVSYRDAGAAPACGATAADADGDDADGDDTGEPVTEPADTGAEAAPDAAMLSLQHQVYSRTAAELFWRFDSSDSAYPAVSPVFDIYRNDSLLGRSSGRSWWDDSLQAGQNYRYRVIAIRSDGSDGVSASTALTTTDPSADAGDSHSPSDSDSDTGTGTDTDSDGVDDDATDAAHGDVSIHAAPRNLTALIYSRRAAELFWEPPGADSSNTVVSYQVLRNDVILTERDARSYFEASLTPGETYNYEVRARFASGELGDAGRITIISGNRVISEATPATGTPDADDAPTPGTRPAAPQNLRGAVYSGTALELFWDRYQPGRPGVTYRIVRNGVALTVREGNSYFDSGLQPAERYYYEVTTIDSDGTASAPASIMLDTR